MDTTMDYSLLDSKDSPVDEELLQYNEFYNMEVILDGTLIRYNSELY